MAPIRSDPPTDRTACIVLAAGSGERLGPGTPKAFVSLAGRPMLWFSLRAVGEAGGLDSVILVVPEGRESEGREVVANALRSWSLSVLVVPGGETRQASVRCGIEALPPDVTEVLCHDAARPLATPELFRRVVTALRPVDTEGVVPVVPSPDTVKRIREDRVVETLAPREELALAQTPQGFEVSALLAAHRDAPAIGTGATDDAMLLERAGYRVVAVPGERSNLKITTAEDLLQAELMIRELSSHPQAAP
jgi:2-C-methyl-D-erythritol 4-phosphate cytidylyltransferase